MKKQLSTLAGILAAAAIIAPVLQAETSVGITNINVTATVPGISTFTASIFNIDGNTDPSNDVANTAIGFGSVASTAGAWSSLPGQYVHMAVQDNSVSWRLRTYTNNFVTTPSSTTWGATFGGMIGSVAGTKVPMGWLNNDTSLANGPGTGDPTNGTTNGWTFFKDLREPDFATADSGGYTNIAFGAANFTNIVRPNVGGSTGLPTVTSPWYFYVEGNFNNAPSTSYTTTLVLELLNQ